MGFPKDAVVGRSYLAWLASAQAALKVGMKNFIERDCSTWLEFLDLRKLLPMATQVNLLDMLGQDRKSVV